MDRYRRRYMVIDRKDIERAREVLTKYYDRGDIDRITIEMNYKCEQILIGLECSTDDYMTIAKEFGIELS